LNWIGIHTAWTKKRWKSSRKRTCRRRLFFVVDVAIIISPVIRWGSHGNEYEQR
jgi:hypothetical protein